MLVRKYDNKDINSMVTIWNEVVENGVAVDDNAVALHIGEKLVTDCLLQAKELGFKILQFNAVVESNVHARHLYERVGFKQLGTIPHGFRMKDGTYENICPYFKEL